jgi:hypothetical protein
MNKEGFRKFLQDRNLSHHEIKQHLSVVEQFESFLSRPLVIDSPQPPTIDETRAFVSLLANENTDTFENLLALLRYGRFAHNRDVYLAILELLDGGEVMNNLYKKLAETLSEQLRDEIFEGIKRPTWGTPNTEKPYLMQIALNRVVNLTDTQTCRQILSGCLRDLPEEPYLKDKLLYSEYSNLDEFLIRKRQDFISSLEQIKKEGELFFNQEITDEVIDFVRENPEISQGVRRGDVLYVTKIPYMTKEYLTETNEVMKRYYYCHCPWARESLINDDVHVPEIFCQCSAGFHKKAWEVIFDQPLKADVLESVLKGDQQCRFAIHLPSDI